MSKLRLHLDADASRHDLYKALIARGHDVTRTPNDWILESASDDTQLLAATAHGRCIFTFNYHDFLDLVKRRPDHRGIIIAHQHKWTVSALIAALDRILTETEAEDWVGQVRWLNDWRVR